MGSEWHCGQRNASWHPLPAIFQCENHAIVNDFPNFAAPCVQILQTEPKTEGIKKKTSWKTVPFNLAHRAQMKVYVETGHDKQGG